MPLALAGRRGLVHPLVAFERGLGTNVDVGADIIELEVVGVGADLGHAYLVLCVAGVGHALYVCALVRVVTRAGDLKGLGQVSALGLLLEFLEAVSAEEEAVVEVVTYSEPPEPTGVVVVQIPVVGHRGCCGERHYGRHRRYHR